MAANKTLAATIVEPTNRVRIRSVLLTNTKCSKTCAECYVQTKFKVNEWTWVFVEEIERHLAARLCRIMTTPLAFSPSRGSMTSEELNRTIEFIVASQARLAA